ncbi:DUF1329 domain-containing protein [Pseudomonas panipatensis]|uniref:Sigma E regulatory protein, MucB/RseB n=1 Tax=Pseudomonas panipatensis TaxID=428992 RepID=A0A1G8ELJ4_9PSED|nr:DUF1329 domain-containing protein [Pseudomonas panipatensis]SDH70813.1 Protein of unknown function [Pseudomonas panipatensis]SMP68343.1 Protein of unknown function [Pseudomonas panipatensis]
MKILSRSALPLAALLMLTSQCALAAVSAVEAEKLGRELTCIGAEKAGNADGSIPAYSGAWLGTPPGLHFAGVGTRHPDPYASEKPLYTITAQNMAQYEARLSDGQKALLHKYPSSFAIPVYPTHRDFRYDDYRCDITRKNAVSAELEDGNMGERALRGGTPFPIPKNGDELLRNILLPAYAAEEDAVYDQAVVYQDGKIAWGQMRFEILDLTGDDYHGQPTDGVFALSRVTTLKPDRQKGEVSLTYTYFNEAKNPQTSWQYNPGTRRVRQSPGYGFDIPLGVGGFRTIDDDRLFNGSPERYNWKMLGKREMYVPYNGYRLEAEGVKYQDLLKVGSIDPSVMRYELHRVWVLEATLKEGYRHQYAKRVLYIDEDSWNAIMADNYDARGQLWRTNFLNSYYAYGAKVFQAGVTVYHDLVSGSYLADRLTNEGAPPRVNGDRLKPFMFTTDMLRQAGK